MKNTMLREHLALAERHVTEGERHIADPPPWTHFLAPVNGGGVLRRRNRFRFHLRVNTEGSLPIDPSSASLLHGPPKVLLN
jgi:hypothetical protein